VKEADILPYCFSFAYNQTIYVALDEDLIVNKHLPSVQLRIHNSPVHIVMHNTKVPIKGSRKKIALVRTWH